MVESIVIVLTAVTLIVLSSVRFAAAGISSSRSGAEIRRRRSLDVANLRQAAEVARLNSDLKLSTRDQGGVDWRVMEVAEIVEESQDCRSYYLIDPSGQPLPDFLPGQHLLVRPAFAGSYQTVRCYSLSSAPHPKYWRITVKREKTNHLAGRHSGRGLSQWLHDTIREGDCLLVGGPNGQFHLNDEIGPVVLLAAGIGITPLASMLRWLLENQPERPVSLLFQARDAHHWPLGPVLHQWQQYSPQLRVTTFFSNASQREIERVRGSYPGNFAAGRLDVHDVLEHSQHLSNSEFYLCGPEKWMQSVRDALRDAGVSVNRVHWESFGSSNAPGTQASTAGFKPRQVRFAHCDVVTQWQDPNQSLWELARQHDVVLPSGCLSGVCGSCRAKLLEGEVEYDRSISLELATDECLTCVARPKTDLVIDA